MRPADQALRALADLIIFYAGRTDIPQSEREGHLRCAETLRRAQRGEMTYLEAAEEMDANAVAK
jgi:hypothetical protein